MEETNLIDRIEGLTLLEYDKKENDRLTRKLAPRTTVQAHQGFYWWSKRIIDFGQFLSILLGVGLPIMIYEKMPSIGILVFSLGLVALIGLEWVKRFCIGKSNELRIANTKQENKVSPLTYNVAKVVFICGSMGISFVGAPYVVNWFAQHEALEDIESIALTFEQKEEAVSSYWLGLKNEDLAKAKNIHEENSWQGKTSRDARPAKLLLETKAVEKVDSLNSKLAVLSELELAAIQEAKAKNDVILEDHKAWCNGFSWFGCIASILIELVVLVLTYWNYNFEDRKIQENKAKDKLLREQLDAQGESQSDNHKGERQRAKVVKEVETPKQKVIEFQASTPIGFNHVEPKEGGIIKGEGRKRDRVYVKVNGRLTAKTEGEINTLIAAQSEGSPRIDYLTNLKMLLK